MVKTTWTFLEYCKKNNLEGVNAYLSRGADVNSIDEIGRSALMFACERGNSAIVSRLVQVPGLDINYQDEDGYTAAILACCHGQTECVRRLAETGKVDWNKRNRWGQTPLYWALNNGHSLIVEIIVKQSNIDYNIKTIDGETLAQVAVMEGNVKSVETLAAQEKCQCWNVPDSDGDTPVFKALKTNKMEILEILLKSPSVDLNLNCMDYEGWSLAFRAIAMKNLGKY